MAVDTPGTGNSPCFTYGTYGSLETPASPQGYRPVSPPEYSSGYRPASPKSSRPSWGSETSDAKTSATPMADEEIIDLGDRRRFRLAIGSETLWDYPMCPSVRIAVMGTRRVRSALARHGVSRVRFEDASGKEVPPDHDFKSFFERCVPVRRGSVLALRLPSADVQQTLPVAGDDESPKPLKRTRPAKQVAFCLDTPAIPCATPVSLLAPLTHTPLLLTPRGPVPLSGPSPANPKSGCDAEECVLDSVDLQRAFRALAQQTRPSRIPCYTPFAAPFHAPGLGRADPLGSEPARPAEQRPSDLGVDPTNCSVPALVQPVLYAPAQPVVRAYSTLFGSLGATARTRLTREIGGTLVPPAPPLPAPVPAPAKAKAKAKTRIQQLTSLLFGSKKRDGDDDDDAGAPGAGGRAQGGRGRWRPSGARGPSAYSSSSSSQGSQGSSMPPGCKTQSLPPAGSPQFPTLALPSPPLPAPDRSGAPALQAHTGSLHPSCALSSSTLCALPSPPTPSRHTLPSPPPARQSLRRSRAMRVLAPMTHPALGLPRQQLAVS